MNFSKFLEAARCPSQAAFNAMCGGELRHKTDRLSCIKCGTDYLFESTYGFPIFAPHSAGDSKDKYEDPSQRLAERYLGIYAFGHQFLRRGEAEGFHRTIAELAYTTPLLRDGSLNILDVGCGVGRTTCDLARYFQNSFIIGIDFSERMLGFASRMAFGNVPGKPIELSLGEDGFGPARAEGLDLGNAFLAQADAMRLPFLSGSFDLVVSPNLIDRVPDPENLVRQVVRVLRPGGVFVFADPIDWINPTHWDQWRTLDDIERLFQENGLNVEISFDGLVYRELRDGRDAHTDWKVLVIRAAKRT